jgi:dienelactone hydrolase
MEGRTLSHYQVHEKLGGGGMGVVYRATDTRLKRTVALKFLPQDLTRDDEAKQRFMQEAEAASALDHPNICTIFDIDEIEDGQLFIAMAYYDGGTLKSRLQGGPLSVGAALDIAAQVAQGLARAHDSGIVHRDIKPANVMITGDDLVKIVDFGIAKLHGQTGLTRVGSTVGTTSYMSPEQTRGERVDHRSDIWALGVTLYEMLSGELPFPGEHPAVVMSAIQTQTPQPLGELRGDVPPEVASIVDRALQKGPEARFASAGDLALELVRSRDGTSATASPRPSLIRVLKRPKVALGTAAILTVLIAGGLRAFNRAADARWARTVAIPEALRLAEQDDYAQAFALAEEAERHTPDDLILASLWPRISAIASIETEPAGADVLIQPYGSPDSDWTLLGATPIRDARVPRGTLRLRVEKAGFGSVERALLPTDRIILSREGTATPGMVRVPARRLHTRLNGLNGMLFLPAPGYEIDRYEVTHRAFKDFVDAGGYEDPQYWHHEFVRDGRTLNWVEAMTEFRDATGRPGPSTWQGGLYPSGQDDYPVTGVSWYEATAYASFAGKSLPTVAHWTTAASPDMATQIIALSNYEGGLAPVGAHAGMSQYGAYDVAGNAAEWAFNETGVGEDRYVLGGAWDDTSYKFFQIDSRSPWHRSPAIGFRCARYEDEAAVSEFMTTLEPLTRDYATEVPVSDEIFEIYRAQYAYDATDLEGLSEPVDDGSEHWTRERITIRTAYGDERMPMHLFLPRGVEAPYQAVLYHPGSGSLNAQSFDDYPLTGIDFLVMSGRAVLFPVYDETFERNKGRVLSFPDETQAFRDWMIRVVKDGRRALDYLETRPDIQADKLAYFGFSWGGRRASILLSVEPRIKAAVLRSGGLLRAHQLPEVDPFNFAPRVAIPALMINGAEDLIFPLESSQKVLFELLGTPDADKRHVVFDANHSIMATHRNQLIRESVDWLDRYLGPVH